MTAPVTVPFDGRLWTVQNVIQPSLNPLLRHAAGCCANPAREGVVQLCAAGPAKNIRQVETPVLIAVQTCQCVCNCVMLLKQLLKHNVLNLIQLGAMFEVNYK